MEWHLISFVFLVEMNLCVDDMQNIQTHDNVTRYSYRVWNHNKASLKS